MTQEHHVIASRKSAEVLQAEWAAMHARIAELEAFAQYVLESSGERTIRDKAAEVLGR